MKNIIYTFLIVVYASPFSHSQSREIELGFQTLHITGSKLEPVNLSGPAAYELADITRHSYLMSVAGIGWNIPFYSFNDNLTVGMLASGNIGVAIGGWGNALSSGIPVLMNIRYGAGANRDSRKMIGFGLNAGVQSYALLIDETFGPYDDGFFYYIHPQVSGEIIIDPGRRNRSIFDNIKIRYSWQAGKKKLTRSGADFPAYTPVFTQSCLSIIFFKDFK